MLSSDTKRRIDSARDILVGKLPLPTDQVELITLALIYKFMDDLDEQSVQLGGKRSFFVKDLEPYRWRSLLSQKISGADRVKTFADGLEALGDAKTAKHLPEMFRDVFRDSMLKFRDGQTLSLFLQEIDGFTYSHSEELGNAFEYLLQTMAIQGDNGQFRTPRHIIDFIVEVLDPKPEEKILDPACGTGGFLVSAYKHILAKHTSKGSSVPGDQLSPAKREKLTQNLSGYDITPMMVKLSKVNLFLHGFSDPQIHEYDTLSNDARWNEKADVILANPPFMTPKGGVIPHGRFQIKSKKAEVLFTDYIAEHIAAGGRAGIIVPDGIVATSSSSYRKLRKLLVEDFLVAVVSLPGGVFSPYSVVKTYILILDKTLSQRVNHIGFFKVESDGYSLDSQREPIANNDLPKIAQETKTYLYQLSIGNLNVKNNTYLSFAKVSKERISRSGEYYLSGDLYFEGDASNAKYPLRPVGDFLRKSVVTTDPRKEPAAIYELFSIPAYDSGEPERLAGNEIGSQKKVVSEGDVLYARIVPHIRRSWIVPKPSGAIKQIASTEWMVFNHPDILPEYLRQLLLSDYFNARAMKTVSGVGGSLTRAKPRALAEIKIPVPNLDEQKKIVDLVQISQGETAALKKRILEINKETQSIFSSIWG